MQPVAFVNFAKGYAILTIVCFHALQRVDLPHIFQKAIVFGGTGVHLFFVLSGFGLAVSTTVSATHFYKRRLLKIWLPYVVALSFSLGAALAFQVFPDGWAEWLAGAGFYQMFSDGLMESFGGHFWFISTIIQFYLVFPFLSWVLHRWKSQRFLVICMAVSVGWWWLIAFLEVDHLRNWNSCFLQFLWEFGLGMVLGQAHKTGSLQRMMPNIQRYWWTALPVGLVCTGIMIGTVLFMGETGKRFNDIPALAGYAALCFFTYQIGNRSVPVINKFFLWVSGFSFSVYLIHILALEGWVRAIGQMNITLALAFIPIAIGAGWCFERLLGFILPR